jgi:cation diffusion facilitator CzcD-associated flavoprotein CzcO
MPSKTSKMRDAIAVSVKNSSSHGSLDCDVAIVGAGPYGLSAAAHLKAQGLAVRVFGEPMEFWADKMPSGMLLRSPREASNLSDPRGALGLEAYEAATNTKALAPVPLETFVKYGQWFQNQIGSSLHKTLVTQIHRDKSLFRLKLQSGESLASRRVVVAAGIGPFRSKPALFSSVPPALVSHCYEGRRITEFQGQRVAVIGAGQSALESAALLHENGADVEVIARIPSLRWIGMHGWLHHLGPVSEMLYSKYDVGPAGISRLVAWPDLVRRVPLKVRDKIRTRAVRPAGSRWLPPRLASVKITTGRTVKSAQAKGDELHMKLDDGSERRVHHVLLGTGYKVDLSRYGFLSPEILSGVRQLDGYPDLGPGFVTSVPGLHFVGAPAARTFGPLLYFVAGTEYASRNLTTHVVHSQESLR